MGVGTEREADLFAPEADVRINWNVAEEGAAREDQPSREKLAPPGSRAVFRGLADLVRRQIVMDRDQPGALGRRPLRQRFASVQQPVIGGRVGREERLGVVAGLEQVDEPVVPRAGKA